MSTLLIHGSWQEENNEKRESIPEYDMYNSKGNLSKRNGATVMLNKIKSMLV